MSTLAMLPIAASGAGCGLSTDDQSSTSMALAERQPRGVAWRTDRPLGPRGSGGALVATSAPAGAHLSYRGGRVVSNVRVVQVLYGAGSYLPQVASTATPSLATFYQQVTNSAHFDWLTEYNTPVLGGTNQQIGRGSFVGQFQIAPAAVNNGTVISDGQIQAELAAQITAGALPAPTTDAGGNTNTYYAIFFPHGRTITTSFGNSCQTFCAYHGTIGNVAGHEVYFGVHPDMQPGSGCESVCGSGTSFANCQSVASHELVETVTDAEVGIAPNLGAPLAWYDSTNGEIGDICNAQQGTILGADGQTYTVQREFSNLANDCIVIRPDPSLLLFGGMYQADDCGATNTVANPFTGQAACPAGYQAMQSGRVLGPESRCGANQYFCVALAANAPPTPPHTWAFGGRFQIDDCGTNTIGNAWAAGAAGCPSGAQPIAVGRTKAPESGCGATQYMCGFPDTTPTARLLAFSGAYQAGDCGTNTYANPFTGATTCPAGTVAVQSGRVKVPEGGQCGGGQFLCAPPAAVPCVNGVKDSNETDIDCGGSSSCRRCAVGRTCLVNSDCSSGLCTAGVCESRVIGCSPVGLRGQRVICP